MAGYWPLSPLKGPLDWPKAVILDSRLSSRLRSFLNRNLVMRADPIRRRNMESGCSEPRKLDRFWLEFSAVIPWLGGAESDESIEIFGCPEGVHSEAGC